MGMASTTPVLCINLAGAVERWRNIERQVPQFLPARTSPLVRIEAVSWRELPPDDELPITPLTRLLVRQPQLQPAHRCSHRQVDTPSSVAIMLSHIRCWEWLAAHPAVPAALILEDDACLDPAAFVETWQRLVVPLLQQPAAWDCLVLGYFQPRGQPAPAPVMLAGGGVVEGLVRYPHFFGTHAYVVSRTGAATLLRHAHPIDHQSDGIQVTLAELGRLRLHMVPQPVVSQCLDHVDRQGSWHTHTTTTTTSMNILRRTARLPVPWLLAGVVATLVAVSCVIVRLRHAAARDTR